MSALDRVLRYDGHVRRRGRLLGRLGRSLVNPAMYPVAPLARAFWYDGIANFGDALTPWLLLRAGVIPIHSAPEAASLVGVGSIIELLPRDYSGDIWGAGLLRGERVELPEARYLAVRGELTRDILGSGDVALGDPGLLVSTFMRRPRPRWRLGIVPHHMHEGDALWPQIAAGAGPAVRIIGVRRAPSVVLKEIAACETILSTSLHGLITADAFGIPAVWARRAPDLWGGQFKFRDYQSALPAGAARQIDLDGVTVEAVCRYARTVDATGVAERQEALLRALSAARLPRVPPPRAVAHARSRSRPTMTAD